MAQRGQLVVVGTGIKLVAHTTLEALEWLERADVVFYAVNEPATEKWLRRLNASSITLADCYASGKPRRQTYREMVERIMAAVRAGALVCTAFYGHPGVFAIPTHEAIRRARREGFRAQMLPGISTDGCLFADLGVDPARSGCQSFEATDFLAFKRRFDPTSALILWQAGVIGEASVGRRKARRERLELLAAVLRRHYGRQHPVVLYEAAQFPVSDPRITRTRVSALASATVRPITTLYIPPKPPRRADAAIMRWFDE
jgi:precorrin-2 methylase